MSLPEIKPAHLCNTRDKFEVISDRSAAEALVRGFRADPLAMIQLRALLNLTELDVFRQDDNAVLAAAANKILKGELRVRKDPCERKSEENRRILDWIMFYRRDATEVAMMTRQTVSNILGLAAVESDFGTNRFAVAANNFFGLWTAIDKNLPYQMGYLAAGANPKIVIAKYQDFLMSAKSFAAIHGPLIQGEMDPYAFAIALQLRGKMGIGPNGAIDGYVKLVAETIHEIEIRIRCSP